MMGWETTSRNTNATKFCLVVLLALVVFFVSVGQQMEQPGLMFRPKTDSEKQLLGATTTTTGINKSDPSITASTAIATTFHDSSRRFCKLPNTTAVPKTKTAGMVTANETARKVSLLMYIGVEGTGHHLLQKLTGRLADTTFNTGKTPALMEIMRQRFSKGKPGKGGEHVTDRLGNATIQRAAEEMDRIIDANSNSITFAFRDWSNPFSHNIFSGVDPIDLMDVARESRHDVALRLVIIHRNFTEVIWSTALSRKFESVTAKVNELYNAATVLNAQLGNIPLCYWRTFDFTKFKNHPQDYQKAFAQFFGKDLSIVQDVFSQVMRDPHKQQESDGETVSKYDTLWEPQDLTFVRDTFERPHVVKLWERLMDERYDLLSSFDKVGCGECRWS